MIVESLALCNDVACCVRRAPPAVGVLEENRNVVLLTSFGVYTNRVSIQEIHIKNIAKQSEFLKIPLCLIPLHPNSDYKKAIEEALKMIQDRTSNPIERLVFGDLHLEDIRKWRVDTWSEYEVSTPLFGVPYEELLAKLWEHKNEMNLSITLSTEVKTPNGVLPTGTQYTPELVAELKKSNIDITYSLQKKPNPEPNWDGEKNYKYYTSAEILR